MIFDQHSHHLELFLKALACRQLVAEKFKISSSNLINQRNHQYAIDKSKFKPKDNHLIQKGLMFTQILKVPFISRSQVELHLQQPYEQIINIRK
jgi:hypothetical protein